MGEESLEGVRVTPLKRLESDRGNVLHALRRSDAGYQSFGEVYFSVVEYGEIGRWKRHKRMIMNLIVPVGSVEFVFCAGPDLELFRNEIVGEERYVRLTVPSGIWFNFRGLDEDTNMIANVASIEYEREEVEHLDLEEISYNWRQL